MESKIVSLAKDGNISHLVQQVKTLKIEKISDILRRQASKNPSDLTTLIQGVFQGSPVSEPDSLPRRLQVFIHTIKLLQTADVTNKVATEMIGFLMFETNSLSASGLAELANLFIDTVKIKEATNGKAYELLPNILAALATKETVVYGNNTMTGMEYTNHMLNTLCSCRWESHCVIHLAAVFKDVPLTSDQLRFFLVKIIRLLKTTDLQELPPVVYQLLALSVKGHRKLVLDGIISHMNEQDRHCKEQHKDKDGEGVVSFTEEALRHVEGTIILHIRYSIIKDMELGRDFIKLLKAGQMNDTARILTPFNVALALSVAHIRRFEEPIYDFLKTTVLKSFKDAERQKHSKWIAEMVPKVSDVTEMILETVQNSSHGWDHVTEGMVQLGFTLMDAFGPKPGPFGKTTEFSSQPSTPAQKSCDLGSQILLDTFKVHEMVRSEVLEQILNRVVTKTTAPVNHYLDLLTKVILSAPQVLLDSLPKLKEAFDFLAYLPLTAAEGLLRSVQPLMKLNVSLKDSLMLVLRKGMFSRQGDSRKIAISGYLQILKHFQVYGSLPASQQNSQSFSANQTLVDIHTKTHQPENYEAIVCMEILANLRRCFTQDADVRLILYQGLYDVLCRNSKLKDTILNMLTTQLCKYYETDENVNPPVKLEPCIVAQGEQVFLTEPLAHLLQSVSHCILRTRKFLDESTEEEEMEEEDEEEVEMTRHVLEQLEKMMESLTRRMIKSEMEDFELDKSADFSLGNSVGVKNNIFAILVLGLYDVLIEYNFSDSKFSVSSGEQVLQLFTNHHTLTEILRDKAGGSKKAKSASKVPCSLLSIKFVTMVMRALFCDEMPDHQQCLVMLREHDNFVRHFVSVAVQKVQQINDTGHCDGPQGKNKDKIYDYCCYLARVFLQKYLSDMVAPDQAKRDKGKAITSMCLEGIATVVHIVCSCYPSNVASFLQAANPDAEANDVATVSSEDMVHLHIKKFQRMVMDMLTSDEEDTSLKDAVYLCNIISSLIKHLNSDGAQFAQVLSWVTRVCKEQNIENTNLTKELLGLLFSASCQAKDNIILLREIARDIHSSVGDIDQDVEVDDGTNYSIVNHKTAAPTVLLLLLSKADKSLEETEWLIARMKGDLSNNSNVENDDAIGSTQMENEEKAVCTRLGTLVNAFHEVMQSAIPSGACIDTTLKVVTRLYNTLTLLCKYYLLLYTQQAGHMSPRFEKLIKLFGSNLTRHAYAMITYVQAIQTEKLSRMAGAGCKTKEKKKNDDNHNGGGDAGGQTSGKSRMATKESRSIPNLIYAIEQMERFLIRLTKKSKVDLMQHIKASTARDFRINAAVLQAALEEQELSSDEDSSGEGDNEDQENEIPAPESPEPATKKAKTSKLASKRSKKTTASK